MRKLPLAGYFNLGQRIARLHTIKAGMQRVEAIVEAHQVLQGINDALTSSHSPIDGSKDHAKALIGLLEDTKKQIGPVSQGEVEKLQKQFASFDAVFGADLRRINAYVVTKKGIYNTSDLIENAELHLPINIGEYVKGASEELRSAGKCLAFELPTACGFHLLRAVESVMRCYYETLKGEELQERLPTWDAYIKKLKEVGADEGILLVLSQVREKHRNPVMHPDEVLDMKAAQVLFGIAMTAIAAMAGVMEDDIPF
jgi:hypothetical protein